MPLLQLPLQAQLQSLVQHQLQPTMGIRSDLLLMTCHFIVESADGSKMEARPILDSGSSTSFVSEYLA